MKYTPNIIKAMKRLCKMGVVYKMIDDPLKKYPKMQGCFLVDGWIETLINNFN